MSRTVRPVLVAILALWLAAVTVAAADPLRVTRVFKLTDARIVLFPPSVEVYEIVAGGQPTLKQDWTETAREHVRRALEAEITERKATVVPYQASEAAERNATHVQIVKVHRLVSQTILQHRYGPEQMRLPNKAGQFDWTLGPRVSVLSEDHGNAAYALFIDFIDGHSSGGRVAMNVAAAILGGVIVTGRQTGFASLVDLKTGDVVWFHRNIESDGDLRTADDARKAVGRLLKELPF